MVVHCPLNAVVVGLVAHQFQSVGGHIFENDREENRVDKVRCWAERFPCRRQSTWLPGNCSLVFVV